MENATKGLMIAGAILIAIVLIGIGVFLVSQAQGFMGTGGKQFDEMTKSAFNSPIEQYEGKQKGPNVKALISHINSSNITAYQEETQEEKGIVVKFGGDLKGKVSDIVCPTDKYDQSAATKARNAINTGKDYYVVLQTNPVTGLINLVGIAGGTDAKAEAEALLEATN